MPSGNQRKNIGSASYASGSAIKVRNDALALAKAISPLSHGDKEAGRLIESGRAVPLINYCTNGHESGVHADGGREPFLLTPDEANPGEYLPVSIYDARLNAVEAKSNLCWVTLSKGEALLKPDTLVYWQ